MLYEMQDRLGDAETLLMRSLTIWAQAYGPQHPAVGQSMHELSQVYQQQGRTREAGALYERAVTILGPTHPAVVVTLIKRGEFEKAAALLGLTPVSGNRDAAAAAVGRTFFGQVDNLRWTGLRVDAGTDPKFIVIRGEATHHNKIWQVFEIQMVLDVSGWKFRAIQARPISWR